ncbi:MAG: MFS transporter [Candidatus Bathyarchaeia archaeon]
MEDKSNNQNGRKWLNRNVAAMGFTSLFSDASHEMATSILAQFLTIELHGSAEILGLIEGLADFSSSFIKVYSGWLSDKLGKRKPIATLGYTLTGIFISLFAFSSNFFQVLLYRTVGWMGRGVREPPRDALLADSVAPESYGHAFGFHRMMDTLGAIIGPSIAFILLPLIGFRNVFLVALLPGILAILVFAIFTRETVYRQKVKEERKLLGDIRGLPTKFKHYLLAVGIFGVGNFANTFLVLKSTEALTPSLGVVVASSFSALLYVLLNMGAAVFAYIFGSFGDKFSKKNLLALGYLIFSAYCIGFIFSPPNIWIYAFLFLLAGVETGAIDSTERSYAAELLEENMRGTGFGTLSAINGIGDFASSITAGILWTQISASASFTFGATLALMATVILIARK